MPVSLDPILAQPLAQVAAASAQNAFDCVIAGGGTTGLIVASELARLGKRVALVEAGPGAIFGHANNSELRYDGAAVRALQRTFEYSPLHSSGAAFGSFVSCLGGRGMFWNGSAPRFQEFDFNGWPLTATQLAAPYRKAEDAFRVNTDFGDGPLARRLLRAAQAAGIRAVPGPFAVDVRATRDGVVGGTIGNGLAILLRSSALASGRLSLSVNALATSVLLSPAGDRARGLAVVDRATGQAVELLGRSVVLAAGAFESVRVALNSGLADPQHLLGTRLSEHIFCRANYGVPPEWYDTAPEIALLHIPAVAGERHQLELHTPGPRIFRIRDRADWSPQAGPDYAAMVRSFGSVQPRAENHLELKDGNTLGGYTVHLTRSAADLAMLASMQAAMERLRVALGLGASATAIEVRPPGSSYHECGGLWMGTDPAASVTNADGAFHRVANLVSADAANWPDLPAANPHLSLAAFAFRKAEALVATL